MSEALALLGTSADPPTLGHQALLLQLLRHYPQVVTWASDNPHKTHGAPLQRRSELLGALVQALGEPRLQQVQGLSSPWAITTLQRARQRWPTAELVFVVGSDLAPQIPGWRQVDAVLQHGRLAVVPRAGWPLRPEALEALQRLGGRVEVLDLPIPASASSALRQRPERQQIPAAVWSLMRQHNLYGLGDQAKATAITTSTP
ncbi:MAG: nicotinate-nucleotide adenylyltransferase [Cyanobacteriota bacterium]|nr:nicotinate-nucleotide adenylyltransferase [Cyanobacteriota bacterium]